MRYARFPRYARNDKRDIPKLLIINFSTNVRAVFDIDFVGFVGEGIFRASEYRLEAFRHFEQGGLSVFVKFGKDVVEKQNGWFAYFVFVDYDLTEFHCKRNGALLTLWGKFTTILAVDFDFDIVSMRSYGAKAEFFIFCLDATIEE